MICGTAAGTRSALLKAHYAGRGNKFWKTIHEIGLTPELVAPEDWRQLDHYQIGFTDLAKSHFGMDVELPAGCFDPDRLQNAIAEYQPAALAFNGKKAAQVFFGRPHVDYGRQDKQIGNTAIWVLPSTSGAASGAWSRQPWQDLADSL